jgi:hypothetical protein
MAGSERVGTDVADGGTTGGTAGTAVKVATAGPALLPLLVTRAPAGKVLMYEPAVAAVTFTVTVHVPGVLPPAGIDRVEGKVTVEPPAVAETAPLPSQVVLALGVAAITTPVGNVSTSAEVRVATLKFGLDSVMVSVETPPALMLAGLNALPSRGGRPSPTGGTTVNVATAGAALLPLLVTRAPACKVLMYEPPTAAVTSTVTVHVPGVLPLPAGIDRVEGKVTVEPAAVAETTPLPLQVVLALGVAAITTPVGNVSTSAEVRVATLAFGLDSVMVSVETPPSLMVAGLNALSSVGVPTGGGWDTVQTETALLSIDTAPV